MIGTGTWERGPAAGGTRCYRCLLLCILAVMLAWPLGVVADSGRRPEICSNGIDDDDDGAIDYVDLDCRPLGVEGLAFDAADPDRITWQPRASLTTYTVSRGPLWAGRPFEYDHDCLGTELAGTEFIDPERPLPGEGYYYIATGIEIGVDPGDEVRGVLGGDSTGAARPESKLACARRVYVDPDATGHITGRTWVNAYRSIEQAWGNGSEFWIRGTVTDVDLRTLCDVRLLGGFAGTEVNQWERDPIARPAIWQGDPAEQTVYMFDDCSLAFDGIVFRDADTAIFSDGKRPIRIDVRRCAFEDCATGIHISGHTGSAQASLHVDQSRFTTGATGTRGIHHFMGDPIVLDLVVRRSRFDGPFAPAVGADIQHNSGYVSHEIEVSGNEFRGIEEGLLVQHRTWGAATSQSVSLMARIESNLFEGAGSAAIRFVHHVDFSHPLGDPPIVTRLAGSIVGNTIVDGDGDGIVLQDQSSARPGAGFTYCDPEIWDNIIVGMGGYAIAECDDDEALDIRCDPLVVGNDIHGNGVPYLDEGTVELATVDDLNLVAGAQDNFALDPEFVDLWLGDYHLLPDSPCIDRGHANAPRFYPLDMDGLPRALGGPADVGADEATP